MNEEFERLEKIKRLYQTICKRELGDDPGSLQKRVDIIRYLEKELRTEFKSTADFHQKVQAYLAGYTSSPAARLKRARKKLKLLQAELAAILDCSRSSVAMMESGSKPLIKQALEFTDLAESGLPLAEIKKRLKSNKINNLQEELVPEGVENAV
jgi:DNA-binding XRE family transcriptional regulator